jgi:hypothetical protein
MCEDDKRDLARQLRIAARDKRVAEKMAAERIRRAGRIAFWGVAAGFAFIMAGLAFAVWTAEFILR